MIWSCWAKNLQNNISADLQVMGSEFRSEYDSFVNYTPKIVTLAPASFTPPSLCPSSWKWRFNLIHDKWVIMYESYCKKTLSIQNWAGQKMNSNYFNCSIFIFYFKDCFRSQINLSKLQLKVPQYRFLFIWGLSIDAQFRNFIIFVAWCRRKALIVQTPASDWSTHWRISAWCRRLNASWSTFFQILVFTPITNIFHTLFWISSNVSWTWFRGDLSSYQWNNSLENRINDPNHGNNQSKW